MRQLFAALALFTLTGCAALPQIANVFFGKSNEAYPPGELYKYRGELRVTVDGETFEGVAVTAQHPVRIRVESSFGMDRIQFTSCGRHDVFRDLNSSWFAKTKVIDFDYKPNGVEALGQCPLYIEAFSKQALAAWGFVAFRKDEDLPATMACNGRSRPFAGYSACQTKAGLDQMLSFKEPIEDFEADAGCGLQKVDERTFKLRPALGWCTGTFFAKGRWHTLNLLGYDRVLTQGD